MWIDGYCGCVKCVDEVPEYLRDIGAIARGEKSAARDDSVYIGDRAHRREVLPDDAEDGFVRATAIDMYDTEEDRERVRQKDKEKEIAAEEAFVSAARERGHTNIHSVAMPTMAAAAYKQEKTQKDTATEDRRAQIVAKYGGKRRRRR
ncbi:hypothetical protein KIPB_008051 [Kipferlia bialata]|uniref:Pre-mRNA-splicing factor SLU7 domain-containing protein n=1 Tax=Kipferlia bialata TaxID=797122 RepID=A0A9K3D033_9EUKA|nr:hypothetical protein KIPB_008051 [Kipferlia bialata]|eukprot:g8051.t1